MKRLTENQKKKIKILKEKGKTLREIAEIFQVSHSTILWHTNEKSKEKTIKRNREWQEKHRKPTICPGCKEEMMPPRQALSRYGHGNICSDCGTYEWIHGNFISKYKKQPA